MQGFFNRPSKVFQADRDVGGRDSGASRPLCERQRFAIVRDQMIPTPIVALFTSCRPSHVAGFVVPRVIGKTVETVVCGWPWAYVSQECGKVIDPRLMNSNATTSVVGVVSRPRIAAALFNAAPRTIFRSRAAMTASVSGVACRMSMLQPPRSGHLVFVAATGLDRPTFQVPDAHRSFGAAIASAHNLFVSGPRMRRSQRDDDKSRKSVTNLSGVMFSHAPDYHTAVA